MIKFVRQSVVVAQIRELFIDCSNILDIIELYLFEVFFFVELIMIGYLLIELFIRLRRSHFFPMGEAEMVGLFVTHQTHHFQQQFEENQH